MSKIYAALAALVAVAGAFVATFFQGKKSATNEIKAKSEEKARDQERDAHEALADGLQNEHKAANEKVDPDQPRDHFSG